MLIVAIASGVIFLDNYSTSALNQYCEPGYRRYYMYKSVYDLPDTYKSLDAYPLSGDVFMRPYEYQKLLVICKRHGSDTRFLSKNILYDPLLGGSNMLKCPQSLKGYSNTSNSMYKFRRNGSNVELCQVCVDSVPIYGKSLCKSAFEVVQHCDYYTRWLYLCVVCEPGSEPNSKDGNLACKVVHQTNKGQLAPASTDLKEKTWYIDPDEYEAFYDLYNGRYGGAALYANDMIEVGVEEVYHLFELAYEQVNKEEPNFFKRSLKKITGFVKKGFSRSWGFLQKQPLLYVSQYALYVVLRPSTLITTVGYFLEGECLAYRMGYKVYVPCSEIKKEKESCNYSLAYNQFLVYPLNSVAETSPLVAEFVTWLKLRTEDMKQSHGFSNNFLSRLFLVFRKQSLWSKIFDLVMLETEKHDNDGDAASYSAENKDQFNANDYIDAGKAGENHA